MCLYKKTPLGYILYFSFIRLNPLIRAFFPHLMYLFLMNTQVGFKIHQEQNKHYLSSHCVWINHQSSPSQLPQSAVRTYYRWIHFPQLIQNLTPRQPPMYVFFFLYIQPPTYLSKWTRWQYSNAFIIKMRNNSAHISLINSTFREKTNMQRFFCTYTVAATQSQHFRLFVWILPLSLQNYNVCFGIFFKKKLFLKLKIGF